MKNFDNYFNKRINKQILQKYHIHNINKPDDRCKCLIKRIINKIPKKKANALR
jgi:hypothetical protein